MAKGDDAVRRRKNKTNRKRMRNGESVSARVASIIASKRRRKAGTRRICEGMCFRLPTAEDPFNDRFDNKASARQKPKHKKPLPPRSNGRKHQKGPLSEEKPRQPNEGHHPKHPPCAIDVESEGHRISKFLILCLNAIQEAWAADGTFDGNGSVDAPLLASEWGVHLLRRSSAGGSNVVDTTGTCATREQIAWLVSMASDVIARKEKQGLNIPCPFLLYLVPSQEMATRVRAVCKPLKALGIHTVSLHTGASLDHQVCGLKSCEPEFLVATPERLLEVVSLMAIDISGVTLLVLDGLKIFLDFGFMDKVKSIREKIFGDPQMVVFSGEMSASTVQSLLSGSVYRLSHKDTITSQSASTSQHEQFCALEEEKT